MTQPGSSEETDYDGIWKDALENLLPEFFALLFPEIATKIDWSQPIVFLDKELDRISKPGKQGRTIADKLLRVYRLDGQRQLVLIHIEIQSQVDKTFARRMYTYYHRLDDRHGQPVVSLAVLADPNPTWRPTAYSAEMWGCRIGFEFPVAKLTDWLGQEEALIASGNPFAMIVLAHLAAQQEDRSVAGRYQRARRLLGQVRMMGLALDQVQQVVRYIAWFAHLPETVEDELWRTEIAAEDGEAMSYIPTFERRALEQGRLEGQRKSLRRLIVQRFHVSDVPAPLATRIEQADEATLTALQDSVLATASIDELLAHV